MNKSGTKFLHVTLALICLLSIGAQRVQSQQTPPQVAPQPSPQVASQLAPQPAPDAVPQQVALAPQSPPRPAELLHQDIAHPAQLNVIWMEVTAYCPCTKCCGPNASGITASGKDVGYNDGAFVAADTDHFAFGTRFSIPGYHEGQAVEVIDRGSAIKGDHLDVFFPTHQQALQWGRQRLPVTIVH